MENNISKAIIAIAISVLSLNLAAESIDDAESIKAHHGMERFPEKIVDRPSTLPTGIVQVDTKVKVSGLSTLNLQASTTFGIVDKLQGEFGYDGLDFHFDKKEVFEAKRTVNLGLKYNYLGIPHVSFSAAGNLPLHIWDGEIVKDFTVGLPVVFYNEFLAGGVLADLFQLTMRPEQGVKFDFPFWFGVQIVGNFWAQIKSSFGRITMDSQGESAPWKSVTKGFWQRLPLELEATYAFNHYFDLGANFGFDDVLAKGKITDTMFFGLIFTARGGRLFG
ncbi:MAG TPA: hypothetical protein VEL47_06780 [Myxococcota bacterium]|nr:hypothetical protein [Myxococcota bacterium]